MHVAQPTPFTTDKDVERKRPPEKSITFLLGPPTNQNSVQMLTDLADWLGINRENFWIEIVHGEITGFLETASDGRSKLDHVVSEALGKPVTVSRAEEALHLVAGCYFLVLTILMEDVLDINGNAVGQKLADHEVCYRIVRPLMEAARAGWSVCTVTRPGNDTVFEYIDDTAGARA